MKKLEKYSVYEIAIKDIKYDETFNCRGPFSLESITELADSIQDIGLQFPVAVQPWEGKFRLLAGHRRYKAVTALLGWSEIPALVFKGLNEHQARILNLTENLERKDLNMMEEARAIKAIFPDGVSLRKAAKELKRPTRWVHTRLRLLELPEWIQIKAALGFLTAVNIEAVYQLPDNMREKAVHKILDFKKKKTRLTSPVKRSFRPKKTKEQLSKMIGMLLNAGIHGLPPRLLSWAAGYLSDVAIKKDIKDHAPEYELGSSNESPFGWENTDQQVKDFHNFDD